MRAWKAAQKMGREPGDILALGPLEDVTPLVLRRREKFKQSDKVQTNVGINGAKAPTIAASKAPGFAILATSRPRCTGCKM